MLSAEKIQQVKQRLKQIKPTLAGKFFYRFLPFRKKIVFKNMQFVFGKTLSAEEIEHLAKCFYSHVARALKENILLRFMSQERIKQKAVVMGENYLLDIKDQVKGFIIITGHVGNWEFAPIAGILNFKKYTQQIYFVRKTQSIKWLEKLLFKRYYDAGLGVIPKKDSLMEVYDKLENHQAVVFVMDQYAKKKEGIPVDFFGRKTATFRSVAMIAKQTGAPVIPARSYRRSDGQHVLEFFPPLPWQDAKDAKEEILLNTRSYNQFLEKIILEYPEQWLWMYNRWKHETV